MSGLVFTVGVLFVGLIRCGNWITATYADLGLWQADSCHARRFGAVAGRSLPHTQIRVCGRPGPCHVHRSVFVATKILPRTQIWGCGRPGPCHVRKSVSVASGFLPRTQIRVCGSRIPCSGWPSRSGSSLSFMREQLPDDRSPLSWRRTVRIELAPFDFFDVLGFFSGVLAANAPQIPLHRVGHTTMSRHAGDIMSRRRHAPCRV